MLSGWGGRKNYELKILAKIPNLYEILKLKNFNFCFFTCCRQAKETESHIISGECEIYGDIRNEFDNLDSLDDLIDFFGKILKKRDLLEEEDNQH